MKYNSEKSTETRKKIHEIIFEADTYYGKLFDVLLLVMIIISVVAVMLESVSSIKESAGVWLKSIEWIITILFTLEYALRIYSIQKKTSYLFSFYGVIDLLAILPTYLGLLLVGSHYFMTIRVLRLLRIFRVLKLVHFIGASRYLIISLKGSLYKIAVFLGAVLIIVIIAGSLMYMIEGPEHGFNSIPKSIYWAIVTLTTVGYGDITPQTVLGQTISSVIMILGYSIIAVPTGIVTAEMTRKKINTNTQVCPNCGFDEHKDGAHFCPECGNSLD